eukprot:CAMPEP_0198237974 /NCGR_PEP_ID=MMETSP1446-20131203/3709_1 /TAXON_ID=1461542 ORGANISM="Unidentified sp, Strain CCMP2111" /NCGR_SAMPLE_ID=MMETSP1446 /ASSEMBLY_ACC=CAM_ASM_001112 /LENGTH=470 /DNA_ID=CAMNT_0043920261 /DNA_START=59 /DNA_END=1471 /DNA_ORIENTATION=-
MKATVALCLLALTSALLVGNASAFFWWAAPAPPAPGAAAEEGAALVKQECPMEVVQRLREVDFGSLASVCPTTSGIPHDMDTCGQCSCSVYKLVKEAVGSEHEGSMEQLATDCGSIVSLDTAFDGANTKAIIEFLDMCKAVPGQMDYKTCEPLVNAMDGPSDDSEANALLALLSTDISGIEANEVLELMEIGAGLDLADNSDGLVSDVSESVQAVRMFLDLLHAGDVVPESMNDSSVLCPGFATAQACESFEDLRNICPWSCERQKEECTMYATQGTCESASFKEACPVTCNQLAAVVHDLPLTLEGAVEITQISDGSAIKANELRGTVEDECMCFNVFQPVCNLDTKEMYSNLCEAECRGAANIGPCRSTTKQDVLAFAAQNLDVESLSESECKQQCPQLHDPVCSDGKEGKEFKNICYAKCDFVYDARACSQHTGRLNQSSSAANTSRPSVLLSLAIPLLVLALFNFR